MGSSAKTSCPVNKTFSALICLSFHVKIPSIPDKTAACTLISLASATLAIASHTSSSVAVKDSKQQLLPVYITIKRKLNGYGIPKLKFSKTDVLDFKLPCKVTTARSQGQFW